MTRLLLTALALGAGVVGAWAALAPASFYADFAFGRAWVALDGPYNEHLIRDVGALNLSLAVVTVAALVRTELVRVAAAATLAFAVPHLAYHATHMDPFGPVDVVAQLAVLVFQVTAPAWLLLQPGPLQPPPMAEDAAAR